MEKMQEANFGHVKLEMLRKLSEKCIWGSSLPLEVQAPAPDASFWLNQKNLKFNISELNSFPFKSEISPVFTISVKGITTQSGSSQTPGGPQYPPQTHST